MIGSLFLRHKLKLLSKCCVFKIRQYTNHETCAILHCDFKVCTSNAIMPHALIHLVFYSPYKEVPMCMRCRFTINYCRFGYFCENSIFVNSIKRHKSDVKNSRLWQDLPISNDRVILPFREGFIFRKFRTCEISRN